MLGEDTTTKSAYTKVYQDDFSPGRGNALQSAVASIFNLALKDVPNFIKMPDLMENISF
jgi:hypothetical protein